jgi:hypothetical protein
MAITHAVCNRISSTQVNYKFFLSNLFKTPQWSREYQFVQYAKSGVSVVGEYYREHLN